MPSGISPITIAIANPSPHCGKTTTAIELSANLTRAGNRVLVVDLVPKGGLTDKLLPQSCHDDHGIGAYLLGERSFDACVHHVGRPPLWLVPADRLLASAELRLCRGTSAGAVLRDALVNAMPGELDFIVLDTPSNFGAFTLAALEAARYALVPTSCQYAPLVALSHFIHVAKRTGGATLDILGYVLTGYTRQNDSAVEVAQVLRTTLGDAVFDATIGALDAQRADYRAMTDEFVRRLHVARNRSGAPVHFRHKVSPIGQATQLGF